MRLIFVYNADSGYFNVAADIAHKIFSPSTYPCSLCDLTYGIFKIRPEWDEFVQQSPVPFEFLHKDEFHATYPDWRHLPLPTVLRADDSGALTEVVTATQLNDLQSISQLKSLVLAAV